MSSKYRCVVVVKMEVEADNMNIAEARAYIDLATRYGSKNVLVHQIRKLEKEIK